MGTSATGQAVQGRARQNGRRLRAALMLLCTVAGTGTPSAVPAHAATAPPLPATLTLPCDSATGLAVFPHGENLVVVVDKPLAPLTVPATGPFATAQVIPLTNATLLLLDAHALPQLSATHDPTGWRLTAQPAHAGQGPHGVAQPGLVLFTGMAGGRVITLPDAAPGGQVLVATAPTVTGGTAQSSGAGYTLHPSLQGLVVPDSAAALTLRETSRGPVLEAAGLHPALLGLPLPPASASPFWTWLGLDDAPQDVLEQRWQTARTALDKSLKDARKAAQAAARKARLAAQRKAEQAARDAEEAAAEVHEDTPPTPPPPTSKPPQPTAPAATADNDAEAVTWDTSGDPDTPADTPPPPQQPATPQPAPATATATATADTPAAPQPAPVADSPPADQTEAEEAPPPPPRRKPHGKKPATPQPATPALAAVPWPLRLTAAKAAFAAGHWQESWDLLRDSPATPPTDQNDQNAWAVPILRACAALLAGHPENAGLLAEADVLAGPELAPWRALFLMASGADSTLTAPLVARSYPVVAHYPLPLRALLLPRMATYLARFGPADTLAVPAPLPDSASFALPRILLELRAGGAEREETARVALENLTASASATTASFARAELVGLLLAHDRISPTMATTAYAHLLAGAEGPPAGALPALHLAHARAAIRAGQIPQAMTELAALTPGETTPADQIQSAWRDVLYALVFTTAPHDSARAALIRRTLPQLQDSPALAKALSGWGRQLLDNDHAAEALPVMARAEFLTRDPLQKADTAELLARAALATGQTQLALKALERGAQPGLPTDLLARRRYDEAQLAAQRGDTAGAQTLLAEDESDAGLTLRGSLYEQAHQWPQAVLVLGRLASHALPERGSLTPAQATLAHRLATDALAAGDSATLQRLTTWVNGRVPLPLPPTIPTAPGPATPPRQP